MIDLVEARVIAVVEAVLRRRQTIAKPLLPSSPIDASLGLDSLDLAEIVVRLEQEFGRDPFAHATPVIRSIRELAALYR